MTNDVPYKHPETGVERNFPEGMGEKLGFDRVAGFVPPEIQEPTESENPELTGYPLKDAVDVIETRLKDEADLTNEDYQHIDRLVKALVDEYGIELVDHPGFKDTPDGLEKLAPVKTSPTLLEIIQEVEAKMEGDSKISATAKAAIKKHFDDLLAVQSAFASSSESTTNPKESDLPGKSAE